MCIKHLYNIQKEIYEEREQESQIHFKTSSQKIKKKIKKKRYKDKAALGVSLYK